MENENLIEEKYKKEIDETTGQTIRIMEELGPAFLINFLFLNPRQRKKIIKQLEKKEKKREKQERRKCK